MKADGTNAKSTYAYFPQYREFDGPWADRAPRVTDRLFEAEGLARRLIPEESSHLHHGVRSVLVGLCREPLMHGRDKFRVGAGIRDGATV